MAGTVTWIETEIVRLKGGSTLQEVNAELGQYCLPVEPLSQKISISQFIREGGMGFNSLREGTLGSKIFQFSSKFSGKDFTYGSRYKTLYNAGYPLHRIIEGPLSLKSLAQKFGQVEEVILPVKIKKKEELSYQNTKIDQFHIPDYASNVFFINDFGAELMGLKGEGIVTTCDDRIDSSRELKAEAWKKRFLEDLIPDDHDTMKLLIMKSRLEEIYQIFTETFQGLFFALVVHLGILLLLSGKRKQLDRIEEKIKPFPLTFEIKV